ncbi:hypothetical protein [Calothrix sp. CCY 0018]|uniref:hypothetical protein n=1 Tax=Calothrix sp. CCY 0018 TaxID=3103864 RepID=UPI0039C63671
MINSLSPHHPISPYGLRHFSQRGGSRYVLRKPPQRAALGTRAPSLAVRSPHLPMPHP